MGVSGSSFSSNSPAQASTLSSSVMAVVVAGTISTSAEMKL